jgi:hypothetical protein
MPSRGLVTVRLNSTVVAASSKAAMAARGVSGSHFNGYGRSQRLREFCRRGRSKAHANADQPPGQVAPASCWKHARTHAQLARWGLEVAALPLFDGHSRRFGSTVFGLIATKRTQKRQRVAPPGAIVETAVAVRASRRYTSHGGGPPTERCTRQ